MFWLKRNLPRLVIAPSFGVIMWFVYGFILWTIYISFTKSKLLPKYEFILYGKYEEPSFYEHNPSSTLVSYSIIYGGTKIASDWAGPLKNFEPVIVTITSYSSKYLDQNLSSLPRSHSATLIPPIDLTCSANYGLSLSCIPVLLP